MSVQFLIGPRGEALCDAFLRLQHRFPRLIPNGLLRWLGRYLLLLPSSFLNVHSNRLIFALFFLRHKASSTGIQVKMFSVSPNSWGLAIAGDHLQHIDLALLTREIHRLASGLKVIDESHLTVSDKGITSHYLEIKKMKGGLISFNERGHLQRQLSVTLNNRHAFIPRLMLMENAEDLFKNIQRLSRELTHLRDLPQGMISLIECSSNTLKFLVVILRIIQPHTPSIASLSHKLPPSCYFSIEKILITGRLKKKYPKEATIFTVELNHSIFLTSDQVLNLREARCYLVKALETLLGSFRDFNGGLLNKETEQLKAIKSRLYSNHQALVPLFESFFYNIQPITMRLLITQMAGIQIATLLQQALASSAPPEEPYGLHTFSNADIHIIIIKTRNAKWRHSFSNKILSKSTQTAYSFLEHEGYLYFCFFHQYPEDLSLLAVIQRALNDQFKSTPTASAFLRLNFQGGDPPSLNPRLGTDIHCHVLYNMLFEGLTRMDPLGQPVPAAAKTIEISPDGRSYVFHLRDSTWSNGTEVTAYHFERAWKQALLLNAAIPNRSDFFHPIKNALAAKQNPAKVHLVGIQAVDTRTLIVELERPCSYFLNLTATPLYFPILEDSAEPNHFNGPFTVAHWERGYQLILSKNLYYWNASQVRLHGVSIAMVQNAHQSYQMFQNQALDLIGDPICPWPKHILSELIKNPLVERRPVSRIFWLHCNTHDPLLQNLHLRKALSLAIDRQQLAAEVFIDQQPTDSPLPLKYSQHVNTSLTADISKAKEHLKQALIELHLTQLPPLTIMHSDLSFEQELISALITQWEKALSLSILKQAVSWADFSAALDCKDFQLAGLFRRDVLNHPVSYLSFFKSTLNPLPGWKNQIFEDLFNACDSPEVLKQLEKILIEELPVIPLVNQIHFTLTHPRIKGIQWEQNGCFNLMEAYVDENLI